MKTKTKKLSAKEWESIALECKARLVTALNFLKCQGGGLIVTRDEKGNFGEGKHWRVIFADTLERFPGVKVNREYLFYGDLNAKERRAFDKEQLEKKDK